ncbi:hypothetical protein BSKO_03880 [Bryopsis sp. KO-2023]|nr:hypothetical protein BSKO_03880 [Bryopsis sp. KO-2023]
MAVSEDDTVASLDRVLTRLAMTDEDKLEPVLSKLIPAVIGQLKTPTGKIQKKVLEILQHVNARIRGQPKLELPLEALVDLFSDAESGPMVKSFALVYIDMSFVQCAKGARGRVVAKLLNGISGRNAQQKDILLRLAVWGLEDFKTARPEMGSTKSVKDLVYEEYGFLKSDADLGVFMDYCLKWLMYQSQDLMVKVKRVDGHRQALVLGNQAGGDADDMEVDQQGGEAQPQPQGPSTPQGLSVHDVKLLEGKRAPSLDELSRRKLGILRFIAAAELDGNKTVMHYAVASCDPQEHVSKEGDELFKRHSRVDAHKGDVDMEDVTLVAKIFSLLHGCSGDDGSPKVEPAGPLLQSKLLTLIVRSAVAANSFPDNIQVIRECIYSGCTAKIRQQGMEFAVWMLRHADAEKLQTVAPEMQQELLNLLDDDPNQALGDSSVASKRGFTYQALGQMAQKVPSVFQDNPDIAERLFLSLTSEPAGVRAQVQEAISVMATAYKGSEDDARKDIENLLIKSIQSSEAAVRLCAVQWAVKLFPYEHIPARYICILGAGDTKVEVAEEAKRGLKTVKTDIRLQPLIKSMQENVASKHAETVLPDLDEFLDYLRIKQPKFKNISEMNEPLLLSPAGFLALLRFLKLCWDDCCKKDGITEELIAKYATVVEHAVIRDTTSELLAEAMGLIVHVAEKRCDEIADRYSERVGWLKAFLPHVDQDVRLLTGRLLGITTGALSPSAAEDLIQTLSAPIKGASQGKKFDAKEGSIGATGYILAQCATLKPRISTEVAKGAVSNLVDCLEDASPQISASAALAIGHIGLQGPLTLAEPSAQSMIGIAEKMVQLLSGKDHKMVGKVVRAIGFLCEGLWENSEVTEKLVEGLLALRTSKSEEVQFAVGEAVSFAFGGVPVTTDTILRCNFTSLEHSIGTLDEPEAMQDVEMADSTPRGESSGRKAMQDRILGAIFDECITHSRVEVRTSGCVWLVCLLAYTGRHPRLLDVLEKVQTFLLMLIGDANELTQEMASRGLSLVYSLGGEEARKNLVAGLTGVLQGGVSGNRAVKVDSETKVFEEGQLGKSPGGAGMSTYKELCALATDLGQPDLIYKFMDLANHQMALNSRRGAAFGFARIAKLAGDQLQPHIAKLIPKLYRYQHDPNGKVQESMTHIWHALVAEPKKTVDEHLDAIMKELLREMGSRLWRNRESSCRAMADLIQGRKWAELGIYMTDIWSMALRVVDDIKESTRQAGWVLMRTLKGITFRLTDTAHTNARDASAAVNVILPLILEKGVQSSSGDIRALSIDIVAKMAKGAGPGPLTPILPDLVSMMLESLSGLESSKLNYIEQHAQGMGIDAEKLENMRVSASKSTPMQDTLDLCVRYVNGEALASLVPKLVEMVRRGVGLNTRVGTARFIGQLATRMTSELTPHTAALAKVIVSKSMTEHSATVRKAYASCLALVAKYATAKRVEKIVMGCLTSYQEQSDRDAQHMAGLILKELNRQAPEAFQAHAASIIPAAFFARFSEDEGVGAVWKGVWDEGIPSESAAARIYAEELTKGLILGLQSQQWGRKAAAAKAISSLSEINAEAIQPHARTIAAQLLKEVPGRIWDGKENILQALASLCKRCPKQMGEVSTEVIAALKGACEKGKKKYKETALECLILCFESLDDLDQYEQVASMLIEACNRHAAEDKPSTATSETETATEAPSKLPIKSSMKCLGAAWVHTKSDVQVKNGASLASCLAGVLIGVHPWHVKVVAAETAKQFTEGIREDAKTIATEWIEKLVLGGVECTREPKYQQLRTAGLDLLESCLKSVNDKQSLPLSAVMDRLSAMVDEEKVSVVKAQAASILEDLGGGGEMVVDG